MWYNGRHNVDKFADTVDRTVEGLKDVTFDTIVFRGFSGAVVGSVVAYRLGRDWALVRKEGESTHSDRKIEGTVGARYVIVDDFISSGDTVKKTIAAVDAQYDAKCVGVYCYDKMWLNGCTNHETRERIEGYVGVKVLNW